MARFYLHLCDGSAFVEDGEGQDLADVDAALRAAAEGLRDVLAGELRNGDINAASFIEVEDERHRLLATIAFEDVVKITREGRPRPRREQASGP